MIKFANPFARIVVGYDNSAPADVALEQALLLAEQYGGEIVVVHVSAFSTAAILQLETAAQPIKLDFGQLLASLDAERHDLVAKVRARVRRRNVPVSLEFSLNGAAIGIIDAAARWKAGAIAIGTHGRTGIAHALIGSVAEAVVRNAAVPVIVVRDGMSVKPLNRVVVGVDTSEPAANATAFGVNLASRPPVQLSYCSVIDTQTIMTPIAEMPFDPTALVAEIRAAARNALDSAVQSANAADVYPDTEVAEDTNIAAGMIGVAGRQDADAIIVGTHKRGAVERLFLGSTTESVLRRSNLPVIVVPALTTSVASLPDRVPINV